LLAIRLKLFGVIFYGKTYYHLFLFIVISENIRDGRYVLIMSPNSKNKLEFISRAGYFEGSTFDRIIVLDRSLSNKYKKEIKKIYWARCLMPKIVQEVNPCRIFTTVDSDLVCQSLMNYSEARVTYVEDGMEAYLEENNRSQRSIGVKEKFMFGKWIEEVKRYGSSGWIDDIMVTHKKLVRSSLKNKNLKRIKMNKKIKNNVKKKIEKIVKIMDVKPNNNIKNVILIPYSRYYNVGEYMRVIGKKISPSSNVGVKYHPRENKVNKIIHKKEGYSVITDRIPLEAFILINDIESVYGLKSTALKSLMWLSENATSYSICLGSEGLNSATKKLLNDLGIKVVK
jgi:hypothetical protein